MKHYAVLRIHNLTRNQQELEVGIIRKKTRKITSTSPRNSSAVDLEIRSARANTSANQDALDAVAKEFKGTHTGQQVTDFTLEQLEGWTCAKHAFGLCTNDDEQVPVLVTVNCPF